MIRMAKKEDAPRLAQIATIFFSQGQLDGTGLVISQEHTEQYMAAYIDIPGAIFFVAEKDGKIVGSVAGMLVPWMFNENQLVSHEMWWSVLPEHRGEEGAKLIRSFCRESKRRGATAIVVATSGNKEESRVVEHYFRTGFRHLEHHFIKGV